MSRTEIHNKIAANVRALPFADRVLALVEDGSILQSLLHEDPRLGEFHRRFANLRSEMHEAIAAGTRKLIDRPVGEIASGPIEVDAEALTVAAKIEAFVRDVDAHLASKATA